MWRTWCSVVPGEWKRKVVGMTSSSLVSVILWAWMKGSPPLSCLPSLPTVILLCNLPQVLTLLTLYAYSIVNPSASPALFQMLSRSTFLEWKKIREERCRWKCPAYSQIGMVVLMPAGLEGPSRALEKMNVGLPSLWRVQYCVALSHVVHEAHG